MKGQRSGLLGLSWPTSVAKRGLRHLLRNDEFWYRCPVGQSEIDFGVVYQATASVEGAVFLRSATTLIIELRDSDETIFKQFSKSNRYEIKRAERDGTEIFQVPVDDNSLEEFVNDHNGAMDLKGRQVLCSQRLHKLAKRGVLRLSVSRGAFGDCKWGSWHAHIVSGSRVRLLLSVSNFRGVSNSSVRSKIGHANRLHHWRDMQTFREEGCTKYDFGGYYTGEKDQEKVAISRFKAGFGGAEEEGGDVYFARNTYGHLMLRLMWYRSLRFDGWKKY